MSEKFHLDLVHSSQSPLEAHACLALVDSDRLYHLQRKLRPPLGIYNISVHRVCRRLERLCAFVEGLCQPHENKIAQGEHNSVLIDLADELELVFYAGAEHVDDLYSIIDNYFQDKKQRRNDAEYRKCAASIEIYKREISAVTNAIKHNQARLRGYAITYEQAQRHGLLLGYFVEGVESGVVGPNAIFHDENKFVFSVSNFIWRVILFILRCSRVLADFLDTRSERLEGPASVRDSCFMEAVIAAWRLPNYGFDDPDPFEGVALSLTSDAETEGKLQNCLIGSPCNPWRNGGDLHMSGDFSGFIGDGVTRTFKIVRASQVTFRDPPTVR